MSEIPPIRYILDHVIPHLTMCTMHRRTTFFFFWAAKLSNLQGPRTALELGFDMSLRVRSLPLTLLRNCPVRSLPASLHCPLRRAYATQHPHHVATKPSIFGQPTSKSHTHLGERAAHHHRLHSSSLTEGLIARARVVKPGDITPGIPASEYERRRRQLVDGLPDGSLVVCMAGQVKYMSAGKHHPAHSTS